MPLWKRNLFVAWFGCFATTAGMSLIVPFLPLYIQLLGVHDTAAVERWSGIAFGSTFLMSAIVSPIWGRIADQKGRKLMLLRASLGMAVICSLMGFAQNVYELTLLRLLMGSVSGYIAAAITLIATQTPRDHAGWALGTLSTGTVGGNLIGPLVGGYLAEVIGLRNVFFATGLMMFIAFLITLFLVKEHFQPSKKAAVPWREVWRMVPNPRLVVTMMASTFILQLAMMSIQPIVTVYVSLLTGPSPHIALIAGCVVAASGIANVLAAPWLGKLSDHVGPLRVLTVCLVIGGIVFIPQAFVTSPWQLMGLRFLLGLASAGLLPSINAIVKRSAPDAISGRIFGYNQSAQYLGNIGGSLLGGEMAAAFGIHYVFFSTAALMLGNALWVFASGTWDHRNKRRTIPHPSV
ncbi:multidrug efflux MFS transporter [Alicyclobacillus sp.]|uniref:multidrug efflux MFS transporter n=1 Tax=Alicyclobacillus sp. TaxID=61169 RepID=UPI0025B86B36|nr:multidrug efflux MFS transporter [Alicyclobacillus sp.]MCL6516143.1 multidrug efflux MFS transporter [Alicyclobacillus sp.]